MNSGRFFSFGCSFTRYHRWPTWADIIGYEYPYWENWGVCGGGNNQVLYNLVECHARHRICSEDTVMIMWSSLHRVDHYVGSSWYEGGNVYYDERLPQDYIKRFICDRGLLVRDMAVISAVKNCLDSWGCRYKFFSMVPLHKKNKDVGLGQNDAIVDREITDILALYQPILDKISPSIFEIVYQEDWKHRPGIPKNIIDTDMHATPAEHLAYLDAVLPDEKIGESARGWVRYLQGQIENQQPLSWAGTNPPRSRL